MGPWYGRPGMEDRDAAKVTVTMCSSESAEASCLEPGTLVDHFKVVRLLGRGGMGAVYLARDTKLGRRVALKVVRSDALGSTPSTQRFLREARVTARFSHPHIVTIFGVGEYLGSPYLALEFLEGLTLRERILDRTPGGKESIRLCAAIASALVEAHAHEVLHRDLKPENVIVAADGRLRVVDFGLAKSFSAPEVAPTPAPAHGLLDSTVATDTFRSDARGVVGTPAYMAPEQWSEETIGPHTDVWALGLILWELLSGRHPFLGSSLFQVCARVSSAEPMPQVAATDGVADEIKHLVARCLDKNPARRPTAREVLAVLEGELLEGRRVSEGDSPFRGLLPFTEQHARAFFGREAEVAAFVERMRHETVLPVVGASGAGKSSFIQAGVIPRLREQGRWLIVRLRPGRRPLQTLAERLVRAHVSSRGQSLRSEESGAESPAALEQRLAELRRAPSRLALWAQELAIEQRTQVLILVDQFEELYTLVEDEAERSCFLSAILNAADDRAGPVRVVLTLRDDFLGLLAETESGRRALRHITVLTSPDTDSLVEIVTRPLASYGYRYDDEALPQRMVQAVGGDAASLPLLQFACAQLWARRDESGRTLRSAVYDDMGGAEGALARHADAVLAGLPSDQERLSRALLLRLVTPERTRRVMARDELLEGLESTAGALLDRLVDERLLVSRKGDSAREVELAHESLILTWQRLRRWVDGAQDALVFLDEARRAMELWESHGRPDAELWAGQTLLEARRNAQQIEELPAGLTAFLDASISRENRSQRRKRLAVAAVLGVLSLVAVVLALQNQATRTQRARAEEAQTLAEKRREELSIRHAEALLEGASAALGRRATLEAQAKLRSSLTEADSVAGRALWVQLRGEPMRWRAESGGIDWDVAWLSERRLVAVAARGPWKILDGRTGRSRVVSEALGGQVAALAEQLGLDEASPRLFVYFAAADAEGKVVVLGGRDAVAVLAPGSKPKLISLPRGQIASKPMLSANGRWLHVFTEEGEVFGVDLHGNEAKLEKVPVPTGSGIAVSPDASYVAVVSRNGDIAVHSLPSGQEVTRVAPTDPDTSSLAFIAAVPPLLAAASRDSVRLWEVPGGKAVGRLTARGVTAIRVLTAASHAGFFAVGDAAGRVAIWNAVKPAARVIQATERPVRSMAFSPDGMTLVGTDGSSTWLIDLSRQPMLPHRAGHEVQVTSAIAVSPDGAVVAAGNYTEGKIWLYGRDGTPIGDLRGHTSGVTSLSFAADGALLVSASTDGMVRVWDLAERRCLHVLAEHGSAVRDVAVGGQVGLAASVGDDATLRLWEPSAGRLLRTIRHPQQVGAVAFSDDGKTLASGAADGVIRLWNSDTGALRKELHGHQGPIAALAFHPRAPTLLSGGRDGTLRRWSLDDGKGLVLHRTKSTSTLTLNNVVFSPSGDQILFAAADSFYYLMSSDGGEPRQAIPDFYSSGIACDFAPDGQHVVTGFGGGPARWTLDGQRVWERRVALPNPSRALTHRGWIPRTAHRLATSPRWQAVVERSASAAASDDGRMLCVRSDRELELWDTIADRSLRKVPLVSTDRGPDATRSGCIIADRDGLKLVGVEKVAVLGGVDASAFVSQDRLYVLEGGSLREIDAEGKELRAWPISGVVTAVAPLQDGQLLIGSVDGWLSRLQADATAAPQRIGMLSSGGVATQILAGPMGTAIVAASAGQVEVWDLQSGRAVEGIKVSGGSPALIVDGENVHAFSASGTDHAVLDLTVYGTPYCAMLREVWHDIPVEWELGSLRPAAPSPGHDCWHRSTP